MADLQVGIKITANSGQAKGEITQLAGDLSKLGNTAHASVNKLGSSFSATRKGLESISTQLDTTRKAFLAYISAQAGWQAARQVTAVADAYAGMLARIKLVSGSTAEFAAAQSRLFEISQRNMTPLAETVQLYSRLATSMRDMGRSQAETLAITDLVGKTIRISGADASSAAAGILQFSQAIGSGVLRGDEFNSMMENSPRLAKALADGLKVPIGALRQMAAQGELTADKVINAILSQSDAIKREYTTMPVTVSGAFQQIQNALTQYVGQTDQASGASRELAESLSLIAKNLTTILDPFAKMVSTMVTGWAKIADSIKQVRIALGDLQAYKEQFGVNQAISKEDWLARGGAGSNYSTGGGFGAGESGQFFDGVKRGAEGAAKSYIEAANAAWKLTAAQKAVVEQIVQIGEAKGFDPAFLLSIAKAETQLGGMKRLVSSTGAQGIFQFMPGTAKAYGVKDPWNLQQATEGAIKYLSKLKAEFKSAGLAAAGYNAGEGAVRKYGGNVPPYKETQTYVRRVLANMQDLQRAMGQSTGDVSKELVKANQDQYKSYAEHLKLREKAFDDYTKVELAKQRAQMEQLDAARKVADDRYKTATAMGDGSAMAQAEAEQMRLLQEKQKLLLDSIKIEEQATQKKLGNIGQEIAAAQKLDQFEKVAGLRGERASEQAELAALAERRKQIEINAQGEISKAMRDAEAERRKSMKQTADDAVEMARQGREAQEAELAYLQKQEQFRQQIGEQAAQGAKAAIDSQLQQMEAAMAGQKAERDAQLQNLTGLAQIQQARQNITLDLQDQLTLVEAEKQATQAKLAIDQQMLGYQEQMLQAQLASTSERERRLEIESAIAQIHLQQADNLRAAQNAATQANAAAAKAQSEAAKGMGGLDEKSVKERQLRENAYWDQYMGRLREYAALWREITGQVSDSFSESMVAMGEWSKNMDQIQKRYQDNPDMFGNMTPFIEGLEQAQAGLSAMAKTMLAMRSNYAEGTQTYKDLTSAAERMMEVQRSMQLVEGVLAVIHQLSAGDVYSAIPRAMGVAAMIASLGVSVNASAQSIAANPVGGSREAGGGVFGDSSAKSDSISKSLALIAENSSVNLAYSAGMYRALKNIEAAMGGVTNSIIRGVGPAPVLGLGVKSVDQIVNPLNSISDPLTKAIHKLIFNVSKKITDFGISAMPQTLQEIFTKGFQGMNFTEITTTTKVLFMTVGKKVQEVYSELNSGVAKQITLTIRSMADAVKEAGKAFGVSGAEFDKAMAGFVINFGKFSTAGLKGQELKDAVQQMFSTMSDDMAAYFSGQFQLGLEPFQKAGEGMFETLVRVADGINVASGLLAQAGLEAIKYQDIVLKQGDVAAEITRQSIVAFEGAFSTIGKYINGAVGSAEELLATYQDLLSIRAMSAVVGLSFRKLSNDMVLAAGGVDNLKESLAYYIENFIGIGGTAAYQMTELTDSFKKLGFEVPASKEAFRDLLDSIDQTTPAGQKLYAQILKLGPAFITAAESAKQLEDLYNRLKGGKPFADADAGWEQLWDDWSSVIEGKLAEIQAPFEAEINRKIEAQKAAIKGWVQAITAASIGIGTINAEIARLGVIGAPAQGAIQSLGQLVTQLYKNISDWQKKIKEAQAEIKRLEGETNPEYEKRRQELLREQGFSLIRNLMEMWSKIIDGINNMVNSLQDQMDSLAVDSIGATLGTANQRLTQAYAAYQSYKGTGGNDVNTELGYLQNIQSAIMARYNAELAQIQESEQKYIQAETERLNAALEAQIDAINAAAEAAIKAENDRLEAAVKAQGKIDAAAQKALQKQFDLEQKVLQKAHDAQLKALTDELDAANKLADAIKNINDYVNGMALGGNSPLSPEQRLAEAQRQYQELLGRAQGGDADAMQKLTGASDAYLEASKQYYGSGTQYANTFDAVKNAMTAIGGLSAPDSDSIQSRIDLLREAQAEEMDALRELQSEKLDALRDVQQDHLDAIREASQKSQDAIREAAQKQIEAAQKQTQQTIADLSDPNKNAAIRELKERTIAELKALQEQAEKLREAANQKALEWEEDVRKWMTDQNLNDQAMIDALNAIHNAITSIPKRASGGMASGLTIVGEKGPELVNFTRPGMVYTAERTQGMLSGGNNETRVVQAIAELKAEMRAVVVTQSNANPQIIEKLSGMEQRLSKMERTQRFTVGA